MECGSRMGESSSACLVSIFYGQLLSRCDCRIRLYVIKATALRADACAAFAPGCGPAGPTQRDTALRMVTGGPVAYDPPIRHTRTPAERADQLLSWQRNDKAFFAAGACHILAWAFLRDEDRAGGFSPTGLRRVGARYVNHVYVSDGTWAFDHDGWTREDELLTVTRAAHQQANPGVDIEQVTLPGDLELFCAEHYSRLPSQYAFDPLPRANAYLERFSARPPSAR